MAESQKIKSTKSFPEQIITTADELDHCCRYLSTKNLFGFDTEFVGEDTYHPRLCMIQVATEEKLILIDPLSVGPLDSFWDLVMDPANCVVVHAGREEIRMCNLWGGASPGNLFDLQIAAGLCGYPYPLSHGNLVHQVLGIRLPKGETLTEWRSRPLTGAQIQYAFDDVRYLLPLWKSISSKLEQLDRITWAQEEFQRLKEISTAGVNDASAATAKWRKLRGAGSLDRRRLALVRDLFLWREKTAAETNRPARSVVRDDLLVEIARRNPKSPRDLQVIRGLSKRYINAILDVAHNARQLAPEAYPELLEREQDPPQVAMVTHIVSAFLSDWCVKLKLANNLVAANQEIKALVKAFFNETPIPAKSLLAQGWRKSYILPELVRLLEGKRAVRIADIQSASPLDWVDS